MSPEALKASIERARAMFGGAIICDVYRFDETTEELMQHFKRDLEIVGRQYMAEHPTDDDEKLTPEWLESVGWYFDEATVMTHQDCNVYLSWDAGKPDKPWVVFVEVYELGKVRTRGDVRRLRQVLSMN